MKFVIIFIILSLNAYAELPKGMRWEDLPEYPKTNMGWCKVHVDDIRPTQKTVGHFHVEERVEEINKLYKGKSYPDFLELREEKTTEFVIGPQREIYINDRHHYGSAMINSDIPKKEKYIAGKIIGNLENLSEREFWRVMELNNWAFLKDSSFKKISYRDIPRSLKHLEDNPLRSLASVILKDNPLQDVVKIGIPFEEFFYAEFLLQNGIEIPENSAKSMKKAMEQSLELLRSSKGLQFRASLPHKLCFLPFKL